MAMPLNDRNLSAISAVAATPSYDRSALTPGIVHFGVGNFHRAHQALYLDRLLAKGGDRDWAIIGAGVMPSDEIARQALAAQDFLTAVVEQSADRSTVRVTGAMMDYLPPETPQAIIDKLSDPAIRIVSLTITEGGYFVDPASGTFDPQHPQMVVDAADPDHPRTVFGLILSGLKARRASGTPPFTVMSCDNLPHNGVVTRNTVTGLADLSDPAFSGWILENVAFPNGMVDRITPGTGDRERDILTRDFGIVDARPVFCEDFSQWVLEDNFPAGRPALEKVGVQFVRDVTPYEDMKIRILNGGHAVIAYPAGLLDIHFAHEAMQHPLIRGFLEKVESTEIIPVVPPVPGTDLKHYFSQVKRRFANPKIGDTIKRLCLDGSNRQPKFIIPSIADRLRTGASVTGLALESAFWCCYCFGTTQSGRVLETNDPNWNRLVTCARAAKNNPVAWLEMADIYGDVGRSEVFRTRFTTLLKAIRTKGVEGVISRYLDGTL